MPHSYKPPLFADLLSKTPLVLLQDLAADLEEQATASLLPFYCVAPPIVPSDVPESGPLGVSGFDTWVGLPTYTPPPLTS